MAKTYYIVTNFGGGENYTPSLFTNEKDAYDWIKQCTYNNIVDGGCYEEELEDVDLGDVDAVLTRASETIESFDYKGTLPGKMDLTLLGDIEDGGNLMQVFEVTENEKN